MPSLKPDTTKGFSPRVRLTEATVRPANDILRLDGLLETRLLSPQFHQIILGMARLRNAVSSLKMEGEEIELDKARKVLDGTAKPESPAEEGFLRIAKAYGELGNGNLPDLTVNSIIRMHKSFFSGIMEDNIAGRLKERQNYIVAGIGEQVRFIPTPPERVQEELHSLLEWYKHSRYEFPPAITAALFFAEFQAIHPFIDGNGRLGRFLNVAIFYDLGCIRAPVVPIDLKLFRSGGEYYDMLATTNTGSEYTLWSRFFVGEVKAAYQIAVKQANLTPVIGKFRRESTRSILRWVLSGDGSWFSRSEFPNNFKYSNPTIWSSLTELTQKRVLEARGERKGRTYRLRSQFLADVYRRRLS